MSDVGQIERKAQDRVVKLFRDQLGYEYLGNWEYRDGNSNIEVELLTQNLRARGYDDNLINKAIDKLQERRLARRRSRPVRGQPRRLRPAALRREGQAGRRRADETVWLIDWANPKANHFAIAEEVTVAGPAHQAPRRRALRQRHRAGVLELKRSKVAVSRGHPAEHRQPEAGVHPAVLHDRPAASWPATTSRACATA